MRTLLICLTFLVLVSACKKDKKGYDYSIEGRWTHLRYEVILDNATSDKSSLWDDHDVSYESDGILYHHHISAATPLKFATYERIDENTIKLTPGMGGTVEIWKILTLNDTSMVLRTTDRRWNLCHTSLDCTPLRETTDILKRK